jgi:hypothetical protein
MRDATGRHLTLVVPGLPGPGAAGTQWWAGLSLPALTRFLTRSTPVSPLCAEPALAPLLFGCFDVSRDGPDWPAAAITASLDGAGTAAGEGWWLRADPVHLRVDMGELVLVDTAHLQISVAEADMLVAEINAELGDPDPRLQALAGERWYVALDEAQDLATEPPWEVSGGAIGGHMPRGGDAGSWRAWVNDVQMILHGSPVNRERERRRAPAVNSVWPWGGGSIPRVPAGRWRSVSGDNPLVIGLGALAGAEPAGSDGVAGAKEWLARNDLPGDHLLVLDAAYVPIRITDGDAWREFVLEFEEDWMAPLLDALASGLIQSVRLSTGRSRDFRLRRRDLRRWWRRSRLPARALWAGR